MTPKPLSPTLDNQLEAREHDATHLHMRWPADAETTARLKQVVSGDIRQQSGKPPGTPSRWLRW